MAEAQSLVPQEEFQEDLHENPRDESQDEQLKEPEEEAEEEPHEKPLTKADFDQSETLFEPRRRLNFKAMSFVAAAIVIIIICVVFYHSTTSDEPSEVPTTIPPHEAALACLNMQDSLGISSNYSNQPQDLRWSTSGLSGSATIELDVANSNHSLPEAGEVTTTVVMGRLKSQPGSVSWLQKELRDITTTAIYVVDDPAAQGLHLEKNHGRESIVYLKYILDHFDNLNDITFFFHPSRYTWHNNMLLKEDSAETINRMSRAKILRDGYVNSRCDSWPGCPTWVTYNPSSAEHAIDPHRQQEKFNHDLFRKLFPDRQTYPRYFGQACCSQFAVSRDAIRAVGRDTFQRLYDWIDGMRSDWNSGRMMEMMWQYIFLERGVVCPSMESCYCETYGVCYGDDRAQVMLLDTWNQHRARTDELNEQIVAAQKRLREKLAFLKMMAPKDEKKPQASEEEAELEFNLAQASDPELIGLWQDYENVKAVSKQYKEKVMKRYGVEKASEWW